MPFRQSPLYQPVFADQNQPFCAESYILETLTGLGIIPGTLHEVDIALGGGGIKCSSMPAALVALIEHHGIRHPRHIMAGSGSAGSAPYFIAGQIYEMLKVWAHGVSCGQFINSGRERVINTLSGWWRDLMGRDYRPDKPRLVDVEHLVRKVMKENRSLLFEAVMSSPTKLSIRATDQLTGEVRSAGNHPEADHVLQNREELNQILIGSKAMMVGCGQKGNLQRPGLEHLIDTEISAHTANMILEAAKKDVRKMIAFTTYNAKDPDHWMYQILRWRQTPEFRKQYNEAAKAMRDLREKFPDAFAKGGIISVENTDVCVVPVNTQADMFDNRPESLRKGILKGYQTVAESEPLKEFCADIKKKEPLEWADEYAEDTPIPFTLKLEKSK